MKRTQIAFIILAVSSLSGCSKKDNEFIVVDATDAASSAVLNVCGESVSLPKVQGEFRKKIPIGCEGEGTIRVRLMGNREIACRIGYVTPGAEQTFRFVIRDGQCR